MLCSLHRCNYPVSYLCTVHTVWTGLFYRPVQTVLVSDHPVSVPDQQSSLSVRQQLLSVLLLLPVPFPRLHLRYPALPLHFPVRFHKLSSFRLYNCPVLLCCLHHTVSAVRSCLPVLVPALFRSVPERLLPELWSLLLPVLRLLLRYPALLLLPLMLW